MKSGTRPSTSAGQHSFAQIPNVQNQRSTFDRSCGLKTTLRRAGVLYPIFVDEALPGDTMNLRTSSFIRMATQLVPLMDNMVCDIQYFSVPMRLVWENWERFNGQQDNPGDSTDFLIPQVTTPPGGHLPTSMADYLGIPPGVDDIEVSALPFRAVHLIWNEWYRHQDLQDALTVEKGDGPDDGFQYISLPTRGKRHDYFTSCLPFPQKGDAITVGIGGTAPVQIIGDGNPPVMNVGGSHLAEIRHSSGIGMEFVPDAGLSGGEIATWDDTAMVGIADLSAADAVSINQLRAAFQIQKLLERDARGGTRYTESIRSHFGVTSPDSRLQRPEYLGGGSFPVNIQAVADTTDSGAGGRPLGDLGSFATATNSSAGFTQSFTEHCIVIGFISVRADLTYQQGIHRMWSRKTRYDFFWPALAHIGEQAVLQQEIYATGVPAEDESVWGYNERWAEYRYKPSMVTGVMRSTHPLSLDVWHLAQDFDTTPPNLNASFIIEAPPIDRALATPDEENFICDFYFKFKHSRPLPTFSVPGLIDHF